MSATEVLLADAIVTELKEAPLPLEATIEKTWAPWELASGLPRLSVFVIPLLMPTSEREARGSAQPWQFEYGIGLQIVQGVALANGTVDDATCDAVAEFVEAVFDVYRDNHIITGFPNNTYARKVERPELFDPALLWEHQTFVSYILLTIRTYR